MRFREVKKETQKEIEKLQKSFFTDPGNTIRSIDSHEADKSTEKITDAWTKKRQAAIDKRNKIDELERLNNYLRIETGEKEKK